MIDEFGKALRNFPKWAVAGAFDDWMIQHKRRPSPGEIAILASARMRKITDEIAARQKLAEPEEPAPVRTEVDRELAKQIAERAGFTPKRIEAVRRMPMATNVAELEHPASARPHWSEIADPDGPEMEALRAARLANPLMRKAMGIAEKEA